MKYPTYEVYKKLYAKYLTGNRVTDLLNSIPADTLGYRILDLCGGGGRLAKEALLRGFSTCVVDESSDMAEFPETAGLSVKHMSVQTALKTGWIWEQHKEWRPIILVCQQAINYWLTPETAESLVENTQADDIFVFNTFNTKPNTKPAIKEYTLNGLWYQELSWLNGNMVEHIQICEGMEPHTTRFRWIAPEEFQEWLSPAFKVSVVTDRNTSIYTCIRK